MESSVQYRVEHPYYWLYCCNFKFRCEDNLDYFMNIDKEYNQSWEMTEDRIKNVIKSVIATRSDFYYAGNPENVRVKYKRNSSIGMYDEIEINVKYPTFNMTIRLYRDDWVDFLSDASDSARYGNDYYHLNVDLKFPCKENAYGVIFPLSDI